MAFPLVPFIAGAAVGSVIAYVYKDEASHKVLKEGGRKVVRLYHAGEENVRGMFAGRTRGHEVLGTTEGEEASPVHEAEPQVEGPVEETKPENG